MLGLCICVCVCVRNKILKTEEIVCSVVFVLFRFVCLYCRFGSFWDERSQWNTVERSCKQSEREQKGGGGQRWGASEDWVVWE